LRRLGVVTGIRAEARLVREVLADLHPPALIACTGAVPGRAGEEAERLLASGAQALVSVGLAGGLDPRLRPGDVLLATGIVAPGRAPAETDQAWVMAALAASIALGPRVVTGSLASSDRILPGAAEKRDLAARTGAAAVDMESGEVAEAAGRAGVPVLVLRAVADPAWRNLPAVALVPLRSDGGVRTLAVARALVTRPADWPDVARLALEARAALGALRRVVRPLLLAPG